VVAGLTIAYGGGQSQLHHSTVLHKEGGWGLSSAATHFPFLLPPERAHSPCPPFYHTESTRRNGLLDLLPIQKGSTWLQNWSLNFRIPSLRFSRTLGRSGRSSDRPKCMEYGVWKKYIRCTRTPPNYTFIVIIFPVLHLNSIHVLSTDQKSDSPSINLLHLFHPKIDLWQMKHPTKRNNQTKKG
jgi:hypothetical protein